MNDGVRSLLTLDRRKFVKAASYTAAGALVNARDLLAQSTSHYSGILIPKDAHPAIRSAAQQLAAKLEMPETSVGAYSGEARPRSGRIVLALKETKGISAQLAKSIERDGYAVLTQRGGVVLCGARPRSLIFAAGEPHHWHDRGEGVWIRNPEFALRFGVYHPGRTVVEQAAILGANTFTALAACHGLAQR